MPTIYDTIIIGGGPAGYTAALYATRAGLSTLLFEKLGAGGQMIQTNQIDNYPGFEEGIDGFTLGDKMKRCAERFGAKTLNMAVTECNLKADPKIVVAGGKEYAAKTVIIATGADHKKLGVPEEDDLAGKGVTYCATCDGMFYRGQNVAVVGGGNTAVADALLLARICKQVYLIHRRDTLRADKIYLEPLLQTPNVQLVWNSQVKQLLHDKALKGVVVKNIKTGAEQTIDVEGLFVSVGRTPASALFQGQVATDDAGYIIADETTQTSVEGVFAVGDVRTKPVRQIVTATADGATAPHFAQSYLQVKYK
jgi:thioredoxin reductase (NADPH)